MIRWLRSIFVKSELQIMAQLRMDIAANAAYLESMRKCGVTNYRITANLARDKEQLRLLETKRGGQCPYCGKARQ